VKAQYSIAKPKYKFYNISSDARMHQLQFIGSKMNEFDKEVASRLSNVHKESKLLEAAAKFMLESTAPKYSYNFSWLGRPIIQYPQDMVAVQEIIWKVKPDLIIETGIAHGGSLILSASMLAQLDLEDAIRQGKTIDPSLSQRKVLAVDIDIRKHNKEAIEAHFLSSRIEMIQGSSIDKDIAKQVSEISKNYTNVMVFLDSNHTHDHVLSELELYAPLTSIGSYCVAFDTIVEDMPEDMYPDRDWGPGNNPKSAVWEFLNTHNEFEVDQELESKILISVAPNGYLKRVN
jgi:cephalosporin hydroxylase